MDSRGNEVVADFSECGVEHGRAPSRPPAMRQRFLLQSRLDDCCELIGIERRAPTDRAVIAATKLLRRRRKSPCRGPIHRKISHADSSGDFGPQLADDNPTVRDHGVIEMP
jgi:hypothetical protein